MTQETFMYTVDPRVPIRDLIKGEVLRKQQSLMLTAEEVGKCCLCGNVYRRFTASKSVRVTIPDIERLHRKEFISEQEFRKMKAAEEPVVEEEQDEEGTEKNVEEEQSRSDNDEIAIPFPIPSLLPYMPLPQEAPPMIVTESQPMEGRIVTGDSIGKEAEEEPEDISEPEEEPIQEEKSTEDLMKDLDIFSQNHDEDGTEKNVEEEQSRSDNNDNGSHQGRRKGRKRR